MLTADQKKAVRILITGMTPEERHAHIAQLLRNSGRSATDAALLRHAQSVAADVEQRERRLVELECKVTALERSHTPITSASSVSPDLVRGALALTAVGGGVFAAYHLIALIVSAGLLPWIGGAVLLAFLAGSLSERNPPPPSSGKRDQTINVNVHINQQQ